MGGSGATGSDLLGCNLVILAILTMFTKLVVAPLTLVVTMTLKVTYCFMVPGASMRCRCLFVGNSFSVSVVVSGAGEGGMGDFGLSRTSLTTPLSSREVSCCGKGRGVGMLSFSSKGPRRGHFNIVAELSKGLYGVVLRPSRTLTRTVGGSTPDGIFLS